MENKVEKKKRVYKSRPKDPKKSLAEAVVETVNPKQKTTVKATEWDTFHIKMKFPRLVNPETNEVESDEDYLKRFPKPAHPGDLGWDLTAIGVEYDEEHDAYIYHTGLYCETEEGDGCHLMPRSGNAKTDAYLCNSVGLIETFLYRGEFVVKFKNRDSREIIVIQALMYEWLSMPWYKKMFRNFEEWAELREQQLYKEFNAVALEYAPYEVGDRIVQVVWNRFPKNFDTEIVDVLSETVRGEGGFGSTGK